VPLAPAVAGCGATVAEGPSEVEPPVVLALLSAAGAPVDWALVAAGDGPEPEPEEFDCEAGGTVAGWGATVALDALLSALLEVPLWIG
jgi:hypothetical protein